MKITLNRIFIGIAFYFVLSGNWSLPQPSEDTASAKAKGQANQIGESQITFPDTKQGRFIKKIYPDAVRLQKERHIPYEVTIATAALESGWGEGGKKKLYEKYNFWGLKARDSEKVCRVSIPTTEQDSRGRVSHIVDEFQCFGSLYEAMSEFARRLYQYQVWAGGSEDLWKTDVAGALENMYKYYATDINYKRKHQELMERVRAEIAQAVPQSIAIAGQTEVKGDANGRKIIIVAGHWIDPGRFTGAPGEREFNMILADELERQLTKSNWSVVRPDKPPLLNQWKNWKHYLDDSARQDKSGEAHWIEIHGQPGLPPHNYSLGVIGNPSDPLNRVLIDEFGLLNVPFEKYAVTRSSRSGTIIEAFHSDKASALSPAERKQLAEDLALRTTNAINRSLD